MTIIVSHCKGFYEPSIFPRKRSLSIYQSRDPASTCPCLTGFVLMCKIALQALCLRILMRSLTAEILSFAIVAALREQIFPFPATCLKKPLLLGITFLSISFFLLCEKVKTFSYRNSLLKARLFSSLS